jgi:TRAP-type C4-dicarboxylate transport system permease small subunit
MGIIVAFLVCAAVLEVVFKVFLSQKGAKKKGLTAIVGLVIYFLSCMIGGLAAERAEVSGSQFLEFDFADGIQLGFRMVLPISFVIMVIFALLDKIFKFTKPKNVEEKGEHGE